MIFWTDVPVNDCIESLQFLEDISAAGHFSTYGTRRKLCQIFDRLPTVQIMYDNRRRLLAKRNLLSCASGKADWVFCSVIHRSSAVASQMPLMTWVSHSHNPSAKERRDASFDQNAFRLSISATNRW